MAQRKIDKQKDALERQEYYRSLSDSDKLFALDRRLGKNVGAQRERRRLLNRISHAPQ